MKMNEVPELEVNHKYYIKHVIVCRIEDMNSECSLLVGIPEFSIIVWVNQRSDFQAISNDNTLTNILIMNIFVITGTYL